MQKIVSLSLLLLSLTIGSKAIYAGNETATITDHFQITLPADKPLAESYVIDISKLPFKDVNEAQVFFNGMKDGGVAYAVNFSDKTVIVSIKGMGHMESYTVSDWNNYFEMRAPKMEMYYKSISH